MSLLLKDIKESMELMREGLNSKKVPLKTYLKVLPYLKPHGLMVLITSIGVVILSLLSIPGPKIIGSIVDTALPHKDKQYLIAMIAVLIGIQLVSFLISFSVNYYFTRLSQTTLTTIKKTLFGRVLRLPCSFFDSTQTGYIVSRLGEIDTLGSIFSASIVRVVIQVLEALICTILMFNTSWKVSLILLIIIPVMVVITRAGVAAVQASSNRMMENAALSAMNIQESLTGVEIVKILGREQAEIDKLNLKIQATAQSNIRQNLILTFFTEASAFIGTISGFVLLLAAVLLIMDGNMSLGMYFTISGYSSKVFTNINLAVSTGMSLRMVGVALERISNLESLVSENEDRNRTVKLKKVNGEIVLDDIAFSYIKGSPVFENLSLKIDAKSKVLIFGESGSGKSSLFKLLLGMYGVDTGSILIDGTDIRKIDLSSLRERISVVTQNVFLFNDTIMNNILFGKPGASVEEAIEASKLAGAHEFIMKLPDGYETVVGERGARLSGGQAQRISIARALIRKSDIYLFDEATSHVDAENAKAVEDALTTAIGNKTCLVIAHRVEPSWREHFDYIINLKDGKISMEKIPA